MSQKKYTLIVEWFDPSASLIRQFYFAYYLPNQLIEMHDMKNHKVFLKKILYPDIKLKDLYIGNVITCYGRQLKIIDFGDEFTKKGLLGESVANKTYGMIKPDCYLNIGKIISQVEKQFTFGNIKMFKMTQQNAAHFYAEHQGKPFYEKLIGFMTSDFSVGMELVSSDAITKWRKLIGPTNSEKARQQAPKSIRAQYGTDGTQNACHGSDSAKSAQNQLQFIFSPQIKPQPNLTNSTLCLIKPHAIKEKLVGRILDQILQAGFEISALQMIWIDPTIAEQFYEVYKFLPQCKRMIDQLASGPSIALQIRQDDAVQKFRNLCGPYDPQIARKLEPQTLRAKYGSDRVRNAVHCTDLSQDGQLQVHFIFNTLLD